MQNERASKKQQELLSFVDGFIKGNGYGPSYREIMRALGYKSVSTVAIHIDSLIAKGYLARRDKSARSLEVVTTRQSTEPTTFTQGTAQLEAELLKRANGDFTDEQRLQITQVLQLLGFDEIAKKIAAGKNDA